MSKRRERFLRVGERRINNALKAIKLVGNLSDKSNYEYEKSDVNQIERALKDELVQALSRFSSNKRAKQNFNFKK